MFARRVSVIVTIQKRYLVLQRLMSLHVLTFEQAERQRLISDDPYGAPHPNYNAWHQPPAPQPNALSAEDQKREQEAMNNIMRWASDQIVEIFPVTTKQPQSSVSQNVNGSIASLPQLEGSNGMTTSLHQDILLSMIPGDKSKRSIRIYPASRPGTGDAESVRSKASQTKLNGSTRSAKHRDGVFVKLNVDLP